MEITFPLAQQTRHFAGKARVGEREIRLWGDSQPIVPVGDPRIVCSVFAEDPPALRTEFIKIVLAGADRKLNNAHGLGGKKVRDAIVWDSPVGKLLTLRALMLFCRHHGVERAHTSDRWANVTGHSDYSCPHSHYDSVSAVVYSLDLGDQSPTHPLSGRLEIIDSRIPNCCSQRPQAPTCGILPESVEGGMVLFPSVWLHHVHPYRGQRPRITLAWNIAEGPQPEGNAAHLTQHVRGSVGSSQAPIS